MQARVLATMTVVTTMYGCTSNAPEHWRDPPAPTVYAPPELTTLKDDLAAQSALVEGSFKEAIARLGAFELQATSRFVMLRGGQEFDQSDRYHLVADAFDNVSVILKTPSREVESHLIDRMIYVRHNRGELRKRPKRAGENDAWPELAFRSFGDALKPFLSQLALKEKGKQNRDERTTLRFNLGLLSEAREVVQDKAPGDSVSPPDQWRSISQPLDLEGELEIDVATGVATRLKLHGKLEVRDREVRPTQIELFFEGTIDKIGKVSRLKAPEARDEFRRVRPPDPPLAFMGTGDPDGEDEQ